MSNKRDYPLFLIDRSKAQSYPFDFVTCLDNTVGFVGKIISFSEDAQYNAFVEQQNVAANENTFYQGLKCTKGRVVLVCEKFLHSFEPTQDNKARINTLLNKALKKYLHTDLKNTSPADLN